MIYLKAILITFFFIYINGISPGNFNRNSRIEYIHQNDQKTENNVESNFLIVDPKPRCPPIDVIGNCVCKTNPYILICDGELPKDTMKNLYVNEIIIKNLPDSITKIDFNFKMQPSIIHIEKNNNLTDIKSLIDNNNQLVKLILIDNAANLSKAVLTDTLLNKVTLQDIQIRQKDKLDINYLKGFNLHNIIIESCKIDKIPKIFDTMTELKYLDLSHNLITKIDQDSLNFASNNLNLILTDTGLSNDEKFMKSGIDSPSNKGLTVHLENNKFHSIQKFGNFVTSKIKVYLDNNDIKCPYDEINWIFDSDKEEARNYIINVLCNDYEYQNLFNIKHFKSEPYPSLKPDVKTCGTVKVKLLNGSFTTEGPAYVATCFNDDPANLSPDNCHLCAQDTALNKTHKFEAECNKNPTKHYTDELNIIFGISTTLKAGSKLDVKEVIGLPSIAIKEDIIDTNLSDSPIKLVFNEDQYITVQVKWDKTQCP